MKNVSCPLLTSGVSNVDTRLEDYRKKYAKETTFII
jgi:hypothetical protein